MPTATKPTGRQFDAILPRLGKSFTGTETSIVSGRKARLAKSKDPDFRTTTLYLRKKTLANCEHRLKMNDDDRDMSELVEELMSNWLKEN